MNLNVKSAYFLAQAAAPGMAKKGGGHIINPEFDRSAERRWPRCYDLRGVQGGRRSGDQRPREGIGADGNPRATRYHLERSTTISMRSFPRAR